ncbi:MAG: efflux transporter, family, subunit, partial [Deltaproteobacteria bacterium]|nr:efflux transporter, family, subunit [Deltaproteobacteria bacterium]
KIRLNASMTQNVVTYTVEVITDNSSGRLLPYLTANVQFEIGQRTNVLLVPNAALRWSPLPEDVDPEYRATAEKAVYRTSGQRDARQPSGQEAGKNHQDTVWARDGSNLHPINVIAGLTDGFMTEVRGEDLKEGLEVVVGKKQQQVDDQTASPFTPQTMRSNRPQNPGQ